MSIQIVEIAQPSVIDTVAVAQPSTVALVEIRQGPAGTGGGGSAAWGGITGTLSAQTDLQTALNLKAPLASPALTGAPTAPTAATTTSTTQLATTAFVQQELASGVAVAKNLEFLAHNGSGATIAKGSIVYINGAVGGIPRVVKAQANNDTNSARTIGFAKADISNGANGFVISQGELENVRTADDAGIIGAGIQLYLSPTTPGAFTRTKPSAPQHLVYVGVVVTASTGVALDGKILVGIQNGYELDELHDVAISSPAAKQVIKRNAGNTLWVNEAIVSADVSDATSAATANRLVLRDATGSAEFDSIESSFILSEDAFFTGTTSFEVGSTVNFNGTTYTYGTGAASAHRIALGAGTTGAALFGAATAAAARTTLMGEVLKYAASAGPAQSNPVAFIDDDVLVGISLTTGIWEISYYFSFDSGTCGVQSQFVLGTPGNVGMSTDARVLGSYFRGGNTIAGIPYRTTTGFMPMVASPVAAQTDFQYVGSFMIPITGANTLKMQFAVAGTVPGQTVTRRANAFLRARKIN